MRKGDVFVSISNASTRAFISAGVIEGVGFGDIGIEQPLTGAAGNA